MGKNQTQSDISFLYIGVDIYEKRNNYQNKTNKNYVYTKHYLKIVHYKIYMVGEIFHSRFAGLVLVCILAL